MTELHYSFQPTIPAGTPETAPVTVALPFPDCIVRQIDIQIPPGPRGNLGIQLTTAGLQVWPTVAGQWFITDNFTYTFIPPTGTAVSAWNITGYNTGQYDHSVFLTFYGDPLTADNANAAPALISPELLAGTVIANPLTTTDTTGE